MESVHWFHSKLPAYVPVWCCALICQVSSHSELSVTFGHYIVWSSPVYHSFGGHWLIIKWADIWHKSDLTELRLRVQITSDGMVKEKHLWQEFCEVWNTFQIIYFSMHFKYYRVKLKGKISL